MITAFRLGGFFAAHAIWCVSDGATLIPMLAYTNADDERKMERFAGGDLGECVSAGKAKMKEIHLNSADAALLYDGRIPVGNEKLDAIIIELRACIGAESEAIIAVPYTPLSSGAFRVHKPKLHAWNHCDDFDLDSALHSFFEGVAEHEKGSQIWNECLDESK